MVRPVEMEGGRDLDGGSGGLYHSQGCFTNEVGHLLRLKA